MAAETQTLTVQLPVELAQELDALADMIARPKNWIVRNALVQYFAREGEKRRMLQEGLEDITAGRVASLEQVRAWANSITNGANVTNGAAPHPGEPQPAQART
ncbi:CopG family ribbon-helix-helix protein [Paraburkholderia acidisoli]|uniref:CopG family transcriptional regulator n=1 Tax=Paraburkholderia acidisoli TaxID=2571748 RepID=A0A7Z2GF60_9BURK|nr:ribbon-helix-helix protein, CopG family [Paraburkholderia acidisoli]QGZ60400.1 CopG family transcriptional regulator [Paraburkholderia acidisoli]